MLGCERVLAEAVGEHLVHGDAAADGRALLDRHAGQQVAGLPGMNAHADGRLVEQAVDDVDLRLERLQRLEALAQLHLGARALGPPVVAVDAVAHEQHGEAFREGGRGVRPVRRRTAPDGQRLQPRQRHRHADAAQERSPGDRCGAHHAAPVCHSLLRRARGRRASFRNCGLVTMASIRLSKR